MTDSLSNGSRRGLFVTGTDTGIGKTLTCAMLLSALRGSGETAGYFKPVQTGRSSTLPRWRASRRPREGVSAPDLLAVAPASPDRAAAAEGVTIDPGAIRDRWQRMSGGCWIVEGGRWASRPSHLGRDDARSGRRAQPSPR